MGSIFQLIAALQEGKKLANAVTWKKRGVATSLIVGVLSALSGIAVSFGYLPENVSPELIMQLASAIVAVVGVVLSILGVATTETIGTKPKK